VLSADRMPGVRTDWPHLLDTGAVAVVPAAFHPDSTTEGAGKEQGKEQRLEQLLLGMPVSERTRATVLAQSGDANVTDQAATQFDLDPNGGRKGYLPRGMRAQGQAGTPQDAQAAVMAGLLLGSPEFQRR
jgi:hypothetical protein